MSDQTLECARHGTRPATFVCAHLAKGKGRGFHDGGTTGELWPDAWCDACQQVLERDHEWTDENQPELRLQCSVCYEAVRKRNVRVAPALAKKLPSHPEARAARIIAEAHALCIRMQNEAEARHGLSQKPLYHYDAKRSILAFYDKSVQEALVADVLQVGSRSQKTNTWLWAWGNANLKPAQQARFEKVRTFGEQRGLVQLVAARTDADEMTGWELTQVAAMVLSRGEDPLPIEGVYRMPYEHLEVFFLMLRFRLEPRDPAWG